MLNYTNVPQLLNLGDIVNWTDTLNSSLQAWYLTVPQWSGGTVWRDLVNANPGTLTGMSVIGASTTSGWQRASRPGGWGALACDGTDDYVTIGNGARLKLGNTMTWAWWFNTNVTSIQTLLGSQDVTGAYTINISQFAARDIAVRSTSTTIAQVAGSVWTAGAWNHMVYTRRGGATNALYVNGQSITLTTNAATAFTVEAVKQLSGRAPGVQLFTGLLDDVRVYKRALPAQEVKLLYLASLAGYPTQLNRIPIWGVPSVVAGRVTKNTRSFGLGMQQGMGFGIPGLGRVPFMPLKEV